MTLGGFADLLIAPATVITAALLAWDRIDKVRPRKPIVEFSTERFSGQLKRHYTLNVTVLNQADRTLRVLSIFCDSPSDVLLGYDGVTGQGVEIKMDVAPLAHQVFPITLDLGESLPSASHIRLKLTCKAAFISTPRDLMTFTREISV